MKNGDWRVNRSPSMTFESRKKKYYDKKQEVFDALGNVCNHCGHTDVRVLQIDHVNGGGSKEYKTKSGTSYLYHVLKLVDTGQYQLLCANCNWIKRHTNDEVPKVSHMREAKLARYYKE